MRLLRRISLLSLAGVGVIAVLFAMNLRTYQRLSDEAPVARLTFQPVAAQQYRVELLSGNFCTPRTFLLHGDEWRLDAHFLKWKPWANVLGLNARYRLDRLGGRYRDVGQENARSHVAWQLSATGVFDPARLAGGFLGALSPLDTVFGSSVYQAIDPRYAYTVYRGQSGLLVRKSPLASIHRHGDSLVIPIEPPCISADD